MLDSQRVGTRRRLSRRAGVPAFAAALLAAALLTIALSAGALTASASDGRDPVARGANVLNLNESGSLHLTSRKGFTLNEKGVASGTVKGTIYVHLRIVSSSRVSAELSIYPSGGSITGYGSATYHKEHTSARFSGSMSIERGTGSYAHASGSGLSFSGTIERSNDAVTVHVVGRAVD